MLAAQPQIQREVNWALNKGSLIYLHSCQLGDQHVLEINRKREPIVSSSEWRCKLISIGTIVKGKHTALRSGCQENWAALSYVKSNLHNNEDETL